MAVNDVRVWTGTVWESIKGPAGPAGPQAVSTDAGNDITLGTDGRVFVVAGLRDTDAYLFCKPGDNVQARYNLAKALKPGGKPLAANNRATLVMMPGTYWNGGTQQSLVIDAEFLDVYAVGQAASEPSVRLRSVKVSANDVIVSGIETLLSVGGFNTDGSRGVFTNCKGGLGSFGATNVASGTYLNCIGGDGAFGGQGTASGRFTNCIGGDESFGGGGGDASGTFTNCVGGDESFGTYGDASGVFMNCKAGAVSFGGGGIASGSFVNCEAGGFSFGSGTGSLASGSFTNCTGDDDCFGTDTDASGTFIGCRAGARSFGGGGNVGSRISGTMTNCVGGAASFASNGTITATGRLAFCRLTAGTFKQPAVGGVLRYCIDGTYATVNTP